MMSFLLFKSHPVCVSTIVSQISMEIKCLEVIESFTGKSPGDTLRAGWKDYTMYTTELTTPYNAAFNKLI